MVFAQSLGSNNWEFWSLVAMLVASLTKQWLDQKAAVIGIEQAKIAADHAATAAVNAGVAAQNAALAAAQAAVKTDIMTNKQDDQHKATNSRLTELMETAKLAAHAAGMLAGIEGEQKRVAAAAAAAAAAAPEARLEEIRGQQ